MKKNSRILITGIFPQAVLIVFGTVIVFLALSLYIFRKNMSEVLMREVENKATIFLSAMEPSLRRLVAGKEQFRLTELLDEKSDFLKDNLNFTIIRAVVFDPQGYILDHTRPNKIGQLSASKDFKSVIASGLPLVTRELKVLKQEPGKPEILVMKVLHPIRNRKGDLIALIKIDLDIRRTFAVIKKEYWRLNRRVVFGVALVGLLLIVSTIFFLKRRILDPVAAVSEASGRVASGDVEPLPTKKGRNEINQLTRSFNQMVEGLKQRDQMRHALNLAREVQQNLLPDSDPVITGLDIAGRSVYCEDTGGDYYDYLYESTYPTDKICVVVGDVSDHGIQSALLMATVRSALRQRWSQSGDLSHIVADVNRQLASDVEMSGHFMTMFCVEVDKKSGCIRWVNAGHDPAVVYNVDTGFFYELEGRGIALGIHEDTVYNQFEQDIHRGDTLVIGTDGIWEARNGKGELFGKKRLKAIVKNNDGTTAKKLLEIVFNEVGEFCHPLENEDDITLVIIKIEP